MKRTLAVVSMLGLLIQTAAFAETVSAPTITATAVVGNALTISVDLRRDVAGFPDIASDTAMNFGTLVPNAAGTRLVAAEGIMAFVSGNSHRDPYTLQSVCSTTLTSGTDTIPAGAFVLNDAYSASDNGGAANEGTVTFVSGSAVGTRTIYTSGGTHSMRSLQAHYMITDNPALGATSSVPLDQPDGTYTTSVVISVTR